MDIKRMPMKKIVLTIILALMGAAAWAQSETKTTAKPESTEPLNVIEDEVFVVVEEDPEFPGGIEALYRYLASNIKYPEQAKAEKIQGHVYVTFIIEKDGSISNIKLLRDIGGGCGQEAVRVVQAMPKWKPARQRGKRVRAQYTLPINFKLN